jgi:hypothetical protein
MKREATDNGSSIDRTSQNIQQPQTATTNNLLIAPIMLIQAITLSMMYTGSGQMREPPDGQKENK